MSDIVTEVKSLGQDLSKIGEVIESKLDPMTAELKKMEDAIAEMQLKMQKSPVQGKGRAVTAEMKSMIDYIAGRTDAPEAKTSTISNPGNAGYLAVPEFIDQVVPMMYETSPLLPEITTYRVNGGIGSVPVSLGRPEAYWVGEIETRPTSETSLGVANIPVNEVTVERELSNALIRNSNLISAEQYIVRESTEVLRDALGYAILNGDGHNKPQGLLSDSRIETIQSGAADGITLDALYEAMEAIPTKAAPGAKWVMSHATFWEIAKVFGKDSSYIHLGLEDNVPPMILGKPVIEAEMPELADGSKAILFGDLRRAYIGLQGEEMSYLRDPYSRHKNGITCLNWTTSFGGAVVRPEAMVSITVGV